MDPSSRTAPRPAARTATRSCRSNRLPAGRPERRFPALAVALAAVFALLVPVACGDGGPRGVVVGPAGGGAGDGLRIEVDAAGDTVTYDWEGGAAHRLQVRNLDAGTTVWRIVAVDRSEEGGFASPVRHGVAPSRAEEEVAPGVLVQGDAHRVTVERTDGARGTREFRP